ncbi:uncharacterized protein LOC124995774 [Mugil cephalus]|uniref:uncharacterized protein LOC124995774 n=1 Tax=Mugil cephalus TaxID=48193 RepID=UPI001FB65FAB|nr:uncharacterized protein LOC124995774 [Mugil cephalus]
MEEATSNLQHSYGLGLRGPNPPHGAQQSQGPHQSAPGPSGAPRTEEQHHKPFFYIQPSQPYLPMQSVQWPVAVPMPVSYNPYYGYPGLGYGIPMMPQYQPNPYMEPPSFVVPHTHLHLMDYRRMLNSQYYQTMAYHARRFRYQHNTPVREMTTSEVQTEPLAATQRTSTPSSNDAESSCILPACNSNNSPSVHKNQLLSPVLAMPKEDRSLEDMVPSSTTRTPSSGSFVIQTEEVRIECCTTPVGLQLLHSHETAEVSHNFSQDVVQCSSILQSRVLQDEGLRLPADQSEQALQVCPDILLVGTPSTGESIPALEESRNQTDQVIASSLGSHGENHVKAEETRSEDLTSKNFHFKVVHLPFDPQYLDELRKNESAVWSMEDTMIPSSESLVQSGSTVSNDETLTAVDESTPTEMLTMREKHSTEESIPPIEMPPLAEDKFKDMVPSAEGLRDELASADIYPMMDIPHVSEEAHIPELTHTAGVVLAPNLHQLNNSPLNLDRNQHRREMNVQDHQDTSFESLPAYLPSTTWLADFDNVYYCSKMPPAPKKQNRPLSNHGLDVPSRRRKLDVDHKEQLNVRKPKERYKPKGKVDRRSLSDHECCLSRSLNENMFSPCVSKRNTERLCSRCLAKHRLFTSASLGLDGQSLKRKAVPFKQWNDLPTCEACKSHTNRRGMRKGSNPEGRGPHHGHDTEGESSENSSCHTGPKWRSADESRKFTDIKKPLVSKQNLEKCPAVMYPKLRDKNCACNELQHQPAPWERMHHCPHGNAIRERDENCTAPISLQDKWRNMDQIYVTHRMQTEKSWRDAMPNSDNSKHDARSQHLNKHKKSQSQGTHRKDTRC